MDTQMLDVGDEHPGGLWEQAGCVVPAYARDELLPEPEPPPDWRQDDPEDELQHDEPHDDEEGVLHGPAWRPYEAEEEKTPEQCNQEETVLPDWIRVAQMKRRHAQESSADDSGAVAHAMPPKCQAADAEQVAAPVYPAPQITMIEKAYVKKKEPEGKQEPLKQLPFRTGLLARMAAKGGVWLPPSLRRSWIDELLIHIFG